MNHTYFQELISLHIDNELTDAQSAELFAHLAECNPCRSFLKTTMIIRSHIAHNQLADVPQSLDRRVLGFREQILRPAARNARLAPLWWTRISIPLPAAASLAFLIVFCSLLFAPIVASEKDNSAKPPAEAITNIPPEIQKQLELYR
ncbi:MAG TPA: zf-HC2 domain-containing protein [Bacteroidota bacterium]